VRAFRSFHDKPGQIKDIRGYEHGQKWVKEGQEEDGNHLLVGGTQIDPGLQRQAVGAPLESPQFDQHQAPKMLFQEYAVADPEETGLSPRCFQICAVNVIDRPPRYGLDREARPVYPCAKIMILRTKITVRAEHRIKLAGPLEDIPSHDEIRRRKTAGIKGEVSESPRHPQPLEGEETVEGIDDIRRRVALYVARNGTDIRVVEGPNGLAKPVGMGYTVRVREGQESTHGVSDPGVSGF